MSFYCENCKERGKWADAEIDRLRRELAEAREKIEFVNSVMANYINGEISRGAIATHLVGLFPEKSKP